MKSFLLTLFMTFVLVVNSQDFGKVNLGLIMPETADNISAIQLSKLQTKIEAICARNEVSNNYITDGFVIYPILEVGDFEVVEGGMQTIYSTTFSLTLIIKQINGVGINSMSKSYKGNGYSKEQAVSDAISNLSIQDGVYKQFIEQSRDLIVNYYETHCNEIVKRAEALANDNKYEQAIALLYAIPEIIPSYSTVRQASNEIYISYASYNCKKNISKAKEAITIQDYEKAASILSSISSKSSCYAEAEKMIDEIKSTLDKKQQQEWEFHMRQYDDDREKERLIIEANKEIAKSYYDNQPKINYTQIIKL